MIHDDNKFSEEILRRMKPGKTPDDTIRKRRFSRIILLIDIIFVILLLIFIYNQTPDPIYHTTSLTYNDIQYRFSITRDSSSNIYILSLTIKSNSKKENNYFYNKSIANFIIKHGDEIIYKSSICKNITNIKLLPGEIKTFIKELEPHIFIEFIENHPEYKTSEKKNLFSFSKKKIPFEIVLIFNTLETVSTKLNFNYRME